MITFKFLLKLEDSDLRKFEIFHLAMASVPKQMGGSDRTVFLYDGHFKFVILRIWILDVVRRLQVFASVTYAAPGFRCSSFVHKVIVISIALLQSQVSAFRSLIDGINPSKVNIQAVPPQVWLSKTPKIYSIDTFIRSLALRSR
jgi:hypothetical protein